MAFFFGAFRALAVLVVLLGLFASGPVAAQLSLPSAVPNPVSTTGIRQEGLFYTAPIFVDGNALFRIAAPLSPNGRHIPIAQRQLYVQTALAEVLATHGSGIGSTTEYDPDSLRVQLVPGGDVELLQVVDAKHPVPLPIVTVNSVDARYSQASLKSVAAEWQSSLQGALVHALQLRQPEERVENLRRIARIVVVLALATFALGALIALLGRRTKALRAEVEAKTEAVEAERSLVAEKQEGSTHRQRSRVLSLALNALAPTQQLQYLRASSAFIYALINLMWFVALTWAFTLFPANEPARASTYQRRPRGRRHDRGGRVPRPRARSRHQPDRQFLGGRFVRRTSEDQARQVLRVPTISHAIRTIKSLALDLHRGS